MRRLAVILPILLVFCAAAHAQMPSTCVPGTNIYYISSGIGSDSNTQAQARNKATPWAHQPYMFNFTGSYSHTPGDCFAFRGGETWGAASFTLTVPVGGTASAQDYYGVDLTWFAGGSFTRPLWDMNYTGTSNGNVVNVLNGSNNIIFDNFEVYRQLVFVQNGYTGAGYAFRAVQGSFPVIVKNSYIHDWGTNQNFSDAAYGDYGSGCIGGGTISARGQAAVMINTTCEDINGYIFSNGVKVTSIQFGGACEQCHEVSGSKFHGTLAGCFNSDLCHDSEFYGSNSSSNQYCNATGSGCHSQGIENDWGSPGEIIYNNSVHDNLLGINILQCNGDSVFNNLVYNNSNNAPILLDTTFCSSSSAITNVYGNTTECGAGTCVRVIYRAGNVFGTLNLKNNHFITTGAAVCTNNIPAGCAPVTVSNISNNLTMSQTVATAQGYTVASKYKAFPAAGPTSTVAFGVNLTAQATGNLAALAKDAEGAPWAGGSYVARPTGATPYDAGWAQSPGSGGGSPPTVLASVTGTGCPSACSGQVTITVTASGGTISSVQPTVDGNTFGNACTSSPCNALWDTTKVGNGAHTVGGTATNGTGQGTATAVSVTVSNTAPGCTTSGAVWTNTSFTRQTGSFTATFASVTPNGTTPPGSGGPVLAFSDSAISTYGANAALARQDQNGNWTVWDQNANSGAGGYVSATPVLPWIVGTPAVPTFTFNISAQTYGLQLTQGSTTVTIATAAAFRTAVTGLSFWNLDPTSAPNTLTACTFALGSTGALTPTSFNFGTLNVGSTSSQSFTLTNNGGSPLTVSAYNVTPSVYSITSNACVSPIATGASCALTLQFAPTGPTSYPGTLSLTTTGTVNSVALSGTGSSISIPSVPTGLTTMITGTTVGLSWTASTGTGPITYNVGRATVSGGPYTSIVTGLTSRTYSDPNLANGTYYYAVTATNQAGTSANSTEASATIATSPQVNLSPAALSFGNVQFGSSGSLNLTVTNVGNAPLVLSTPAIPAASGPNGADFSFTSTCTNGLSVPAASSCSVFWTFTPSTTAGESGTGCVSSNSPTSPDCVTMTGAGVAPITISPLSLNFGNIYVSKTSASQTVTYTNNSGATVTFSSIALTTGTQYAIGTNTCGASVANGASCTVNITFTPTSSGTKADTLVFTDTAAGSPHNVSVTGNGKTHHTLKVGSVI